MSEVGDLYVVLRTVTEPFKRGMKEASYGSIFCHCASVSSRRRTIRSACPAQALIHPPRQEPSETPWSVRHQTPSLPASVHRVWKTRAAAGLVPNRRGNQPGSLCPVGYPLPSGVARR
jgi:hypothetical protein